eukprot:gene26568-18335_t
MDVREELSEYELERAALIEANKARMREMGLSSTLDSLDELRKTRKAGAAKAGPKRSNNERAPLLLVRRSSRIKGEEPVRSSSRIKGEEPEMDTWKEEKNLLRERLDDLRDERPINHRYATDCNLWGKEQLGHVKKEMWGKEQLGPVKKEMWDEEQLGHVKKGMWGKEQLGHVKKEMWGKEQVGPVKKEMWDEEQLGHVKKEMWGKEQLGHVKKEMRDEEQLLPVKRSRQDKKPEVHYTIFDDLNIHRYDHCW